MFNILLHYHTKKPDFDCEILALKIIRDPPFGHLMKKDAQALTHSVFS